MKRKLHFLVLIIPALLVLTSAGLFAQPDDDGKFKDKDNHKPVIANLPVIFKTGDFPYGHEQKALNVNVPMLPELNNEQSNDNTTTGGDGEHYSNCENNGGSTSTSGNDNISEETNNHDEGGEGEPSDNENEDALDTYTKGDELTTSGTGEENEDTQQPASLIKDKNDDCINCLLEEEETNGTTGIKENAMLIKNIRCYPNPTTDYIYIDTDIQQSDVQVFLFDLKGQAVLQQDRSKTIDVSQFQEGLYLLQIKTANKYFIQKISIDR